MVNSNNQTGNKNSQAIPVRGDGPVSAAPISSPIGRAPALLW